MRRVAFALVLLGASRSAHAQTPFTLFDASKTERDRVAVGQCEPLVPLDKKRAHTWAELATYEELAPGYFGGLGTPCRMWEARFDTSFDTNRILTERVELARALALRDYLSLVARVSFGGAAATKDSFYTIQGPIASLGFRTEWPSAKRWVEFGLRVVPNWSGPNDTDPRMQKLSLGAVLSSAVADDAAWLPFTDVGWQLYGAFYTRTSAFIGPLGSYYLGIVWGGKASLGPMSVATWLGPQKSFIGNLFLDAFVGAPVIGNEQTNLQFGVHAEVSLSSIWPGNELFPMLANGYVAWSPKPWMSLRFFGGPAASLAALDAASTEYGMRLEIYVPARL